MDFILDEFFFLFSAFRGSVSNALINANILFYIYFLSI